MDAPKSSSDGQPAGSSSGQRAGVVSRFAAFFVDAIIVTVILRSSAWLLGGAARMLGHFAPPVNLKALILACAPLVVGGYLVGFWATIGQTPGKWLFGLKVVPVGGGRMTFKRALVRLVGYLVSALPVYAGFVWIAGPQRRGWHDRLAGSEVVYVRRQRAPEATTAAELRDRMRAATRAPTRERPAASRPAGRPGGSGAGARPSPSRA